MRLRSLNQLALILVLLFGCLMAGALSPWRPLDPAWQWRLAAALINAAPLPLLSLALLEIGVVLAPSNHWLQRRRRRFNRLAAAATLGFLLLIPLQFSAAVRQQHSARNGQTRRIDAAEHRLSALRQITRQARSNAELNAGLQRLNGPVLGPADLANPLPLLKAQVTAVFDQAQIQIRRDRQSLPPSSAITLLPDLLRNGFASVVLACGYAAFARRGKGRRSMLVRWQQRLIRLRLPRRRHRPPAHKKA